MEFSLPPGSPPKERRCVEAVPSHTHCELHVRLEFWMMFDFRQGINEPPCGARVRFAWLPQAVGPFKPEGSLRQSWRSDGMPLSRFAMPNKPNGHVSKEGPNAQCVVFLIASL